MNVKIDRKCSKCGLDFKQNVDFSEIDGKIEIEVYENQCPICKGFIKEPTPGEVKRVLITQEKG